MIYSKQIRRTGSADPWYQLKPYASVPASKIVTFRGGQVAQGSYWVAQETIWYPPMQIDFGSRAQFYDDWTAVYTYTGAFTNSGYFMPLLVMGSSDYFYGLRDGTSWAPIYNYGGCPEYQTAIEAEQAAETWMVGNDNIYEGWLPLCTMIVKNNGIIGVDGSIEPIERVNCGRSYLWRDMRPRHVFPVLGPE